MKISAQDEYGVRVLLRLARAEGNEGLSIPQLSEAEGISSAYMAKITRSLRMAGFIQSTRGHKGGYILAKNPSEIKINDILKSMGGALFDKSFCNAHSGEMQLCTNSVDCSIRSLWTIVQSNLDKVLDKISLYDLIGNEERTTNHLVEKVGMN